MTEDTSSSLQAGGVERPDRVKGFKLQSVLGSGGFGTVYAAMPDEPPHLLRAVKILDPLPFAGLEDGRQRFLREVEATGRLSHRAIVSLIGAAFTDDNVPFLVMDLVQGKPIREVAGSMTFDERVRAMLEVLGALQYAHDQGVLHRDVRPSNVMVRDADGQVLLITDRTGHATSAMIYRYKRAARSAAELQLGDFAPMHEVIPELRKLGSAPGGVGSNA